ncbi:hypothetical protein ACHAXN_002540 [Cyclotella atomus]
MESSFSDGVPKVILNALHTNNIQRGKHGAIRGLQAYLLPNYLLLRSGGRLPALLHKAHEDELQCRQKRPSCRKRKRVRGREKRLSETIALCSNDNLMSSRDSGKGKRKRNCTSISDREETTNNDTEWFHFQMMARIVIAPYTPFLIKTMSDLQYEASSSTKEKNDEHSGNQVPSKKAKLEPSRVPDHRVVGAAAPVRNVYSKSSNHIPLKQGNRLDISTPRESLESLVDGSVCKLVQRTHSLRKSYPFKPKAASTAKPIIYRRRQRKKKRDQMPQGVLDTSKSTQNNSSVNDWLRFSNILSKGYSIGSSDILSSFYSLKARNSKVQHPTLRACPNMAPGVHCIQPNSVTTYARSSALMRLLHSVIGDELLGELLLNAIVFIPAVGESSVNGVSAFQRGNYFQLAGPPLNLVAKQFEKMNASSSARPHNVDPIVREADAKSADVSRKRKSDEQPGESDTKPQPHWNPNKPIPRSRLFYCDFYAKNIGLSPKHLLNQSSNKADSSHAHHVEKKLLHAMVQFHPRIGLGSNDDKRALVYSNKRRKRWRRLRETGIAICKELRRRHSQCDYARHLEKYCPLLVDKDKLKHMANAKEELTHLVTLFTPNENVGQFVEAVLRSAFPSAFWGSGRNFRQVVKTLHRFINLGISESFPEKLLVEGIRVSDMTWLHPRAVGTSSSSEHVAKKQKLSKSGHESTVVLMRNVMRWVYCQFIIPLLQSTFYITDTEFTGRKVVYYRKPVWSHASRVALEMLLKRQYQERTIEKAKKVLSTHNVGCPPAPLRLLPKKTGIRAIALLSKACDIQGAKTSMANSSSVVQHAPNKILQSTFQALKYEYKMRSLFGAGTLGLTEVLPAYCCFLETLKTKFSGRMPRLYFTSADIEHCYDNINQEHLYKQVRSVLAEDQYITQNHFILHSKDRSGAARCRWQKKTCSPANFLDITSASAGYHEKFYNSVFIDGVNFSVDKKQTIMGLLKDHIFGQLVIGNGRNGQRPLLQRKGIPQGSILSSLICNAYFGNIEDKLFLEVFEKDSLVIKGSNASNNALVESPSALHFLVRIVDDFLLISTDYDTSQRFLSRLNRGVPRLGVKVNHDKTRASNNDTTMFAWCGLLIDTKTCEIRLDGARFIGPHATNNVTVHRTGNEGIALSKKMQHFVKPRCSQQLLFSSFVNGPETIRINFYQTFLLCATKTMHYLKTSGGVYPDRFDFVYEIACDTIQYSYSMITSGSRAKSNQGGNITDLPYCLSLKDATWLARHAFYTTMKREVGFRKLQHLFREKRDLKVDNRQQLADAAKKALGSWSLHT